MYTLPNLTPSLYQMVNPRPQPNPRLGPLLPGLTSTDDMSAVSGSVVLALTGVTGVTSPSGATGISKLTRRTQLAVSNPALDAALQSLLPVTIRIKDLIGPDDVPRNEAGSPMCLSYHLRGICSSNCRRKADHDRPLTPADKAALSNWVIDQIAKRRAAGAIP
jgi:hypothetical protein